jgi:ribosomal protein S18 acetylase RimI-like enzyme
MGHRARLVVAGQPVEYEAGRRLFEEYASQLGIDLCFQNFATELKQLPQMYGPPAGRLILAVREGEYVGCVGIRPLDHGAADDDIPVCEMKRLYVRPDARSGGLGRQLASAAIIAGVELGYGRMVLDTLGRMSEALSLYGSLGFVETAPYYANPNGDVRYLERAL